MIVWPRGCFVVDEERPLISGTISRNEPPSAMVLTNVSNKRIFMSVKSLSRVVRVEPNEKRGVNREEDIL